MSAIGTRIPFSDKLSVSVPPHGAVMLRFK